jgi:aryl sulfotransferase
MARPGEPLQPYRDAVYDNRRWERFVHRPGDIFVCTPAKCGTTWTQTIVSSLLWPDGNPPDTVMNLSPWLEAEFTPIDEVLRSLAAQTHRRFIKTHTPADGIPIWDDAKYIFVARDGRDAFMSFCHHREVFNDTMRESLNQRALQDGVPPMPPWDGDVHGFFAFWIANGGNARHVASFWALRRQPNVLLVHYNDLKRDLSGEMRRIAEFLGLSIPAAKWPAVVERCTFEAMKARGSEIGTFDAVFTGGVQSFLFKGTNGRWRDVLTADELETYRKRVADFLPEDGARWLEVGRGGGA